MSDTFEHWVDLDLSDRRRLLQALIGQRFGPEPEQRMDEIRQERSAYMERYLRMAGVRKNMAVLELGSGCGFGTRTIAGAAERVLACDISPAFLSMAREELEDLDNVSFHLVESRDLSVIGDNKVDRVIAVSVFIHMNLYDMYDYFREFRRVLRNDGRIVIDFADEHSLAGPLARKTLKEQFLEQAGWYRENPSNLPALMQWNSAGGVAQVAQLAGLKKIRRWGSRILFRTA